MSPLIARRPGWAGKFASIKAGSSSRTQPPALVAYDLDSGASTWRLDLPGEAPTALQVHSFLNGFYKHHATAAPVPLSPFEYFDGTRGHTVTGISAVHMTVAGERLLELTVVSRDAAARTTLAWVPEASVFVSEAVWAELARAVAARYG